MKTLKSLLVVLVILVNLIVAQPSWADKPKFTKNPDYIEVTQALNNLLTAKKAQAQADQVDTSTPEETQNKIAELEFQKYTLETGINWGQCQNQTGKTLAVYGPKPDFDDDDYNYPYDNALYFLANGQTTKNKWDCDGVYLPSEAKVAGINADQKEQQLTEPVAVKIVDGTQLVIKTNPETAAVEFSIPPAHIFKVGEANWFIPNVSQAVIDTRVANAPVAKISNVNPLVGMKNSAQQDTAKSQIAPKTQPQAESQQTSPKSSYLKKV